MTLIVNEPPALYEEDRQNLREILEAEAIHPSNYPFS